MKLIKDNYIYPNKKVYSFTDTTISTIPIKHTLIEKANDNMWRSDKLGIVENDNIYREEHHESLEVHHILNDIIRSYIFNKDINALEELMIEHSTSSRGIRRTILTTIKPFKSILPKAINVLYKELSSDFDG